MTSFGEKSLTLMDIPWNYRDAFADLIQSINLNVIHMEIPSFPITLNFQMPMVMTHLIKRLDHHTIQILYSYIYH